MLIGSCKGGWTDLIVKTRFVAVHALQYIICMRCQQQLRPEVTIYACDSVSIKKIGKGKTLARARKVPANE